MSDASAVEDSGSGGDSGSSGGSGGNLDSGVGGGDGGPSIFPIFDAGDAASDAGDASSAGDADLDAGDGSTLKDASVASDSGSTHDAAAEAGIVSDFGVACSASCVFAQCYDPGTHINPICSKQCSSDADCGADAVCQASGGTGKWCFRSCTSDADCFVINPATDAGNPLYCALQIDPNDLYGYQPLSSPLTPGQKAFCVEYSEP
jgi:hypothetical protein